MTLLTVGYYTCQTPDRSVMAFLKQACTFAFVLRGFLRLLAVY